MYITYVISHMWVIEAFGTNMHLIPLTEEAEIDELEQLQAGTSWIIAAILRAVLIGGLLQPIKTV